MRVINYGPTQRGPNFFFFFFCQLRDGLAGLLEMNFVKLSLIANLFLLQNFRCELGSITKDLVNVTNKIPFGYKEFIGSL